VGRGGSSWRRAVASRRSVTRCAARPAGLAFNRTGRTGRDATRRDGTGQDGTGRDGRDMWCPRPSRHRRRGPAPRRLGRAGPRRASRAGPRPTHRTLTWSERPRQDGARLSGLVRVGLDLTGQRQTSSRTTLRRLYNDPNNPNINPTS